MSMTQNIKMVINTDDYIFLFHSDVWHYRRYQLSFTKLFFFLILALYGGGETNMNDVTGALFFSSCVKLDWQGFEDREMQLHLKINVFQSFINTAKS